MLVGGKGGVGKTTTAAALGVAMADRGEEVVVVSVDPAHSLADALALPLGPDPTPIPGVAGLTALEIDADLERRRFLESHRGALLSLLERGTYLDGADASGLVDLTVPGLDEIAALLRLRLLLRDHPHVIVDTAPTGHTLRLLELPDLARGWLEALQAMEEKGKAVSTALVGSYRPDEASQLLDSLASDLAALSDLLRDPERTRFLLVTGREPVVLAETLRYQEELARRGIPIGGVVVNRALPDADRSAGDRMAFVPALLSEPVGVEGLRAFAAALLAEAPRGSAGIDSDARAPAPGRPADNAVLAEGQSPPRLLVGGPFTPPLDRTLYLVGGKGGVGKSTVAAALALTLQRAGRRVLLLSVDPAGSLGDILMIPVGGSAAAVPGADGLIARQLEATGDWETFRSGYQDEVERVFSGLLASPASAGSDRAVVERLVDLAPPGIDELAALVEVVDATEDRPYDAVVLDTAPTGHFLRLLELPELALAWTHQAMRLLLKYREVVSPGELPEQLLRLARSLREFSGKLRDGAHSWVLVVALPEALSIPESARLLSRLRQLDIEPGALMVNRLLDGGAVRGDAAGAAAEIAGLLTDGGVTAAAPGFEEPPRGVEALTRFAAGWRLLRPLKPQSAPEAPV